MQNVNILMKEIYELKSDLSPPLIYMFQTPKINNNLKQFQKRILKIKYLNT